MLSKTDKVQEWTLTSYKLQDAYTDFVLSRQAMLVSKATQEFYRYTAGFFAHWLEGQNVTEPSEVTPRHVRAYLAELAGRELTEWTCNGHARAIKTLLRFWHTEGYIPNEIKFAMPKVSKKRMRVLSANEVTQVLDACDKREKAMILLMVDTGMRRAEVVALSWGNVDIGSGLVQIERGKGGKPRSVVIGATTRRAMLAYRRTLTNTDGMAAVIQTRDGKRFTPDGLSTIFKRLEKVMGIRFTPHSLRRTFTILSLRAGMGELHVQSMLGHSSLAMVEYYAQMEDDDMLQAHNEHSPIDNLARLKRK